MDLQSFIDKAKTNSFRLWLLNRVLYRLIPFNKPHKFTIEKIEDEAVRIALPYKKRNLNHIKGLHACALATLAEYSTGFLLLTTLDPKKYRIIMQRIEMDYHYQGKSSAYCHFQLPRQEVFDNIEKPLNDKDSIVFPCEPKIYDDKNNHLATGKVFWQIKSWDKVRTKL